MAPCNGPLAPNLTSRMPPAETHRAARYRCPVVEREGRAGRSANVDHAVIDCDAVEGCARAAGAGSMLSAQEFLQRYRAAADCCAIDEREVALDEAPTSIWPLLVTKTPSRVAPWPPEAPPYSMSSTPELPIVIEAPLIVVPSSSVRTAPAPVMSTSIWPLPATFTPSRVHRGLPRPAVLDVEHAEVADRHRGTADCCAIVEHEGRAGRNANLDLAVVGDEDPVEGRAVATRGAAVLDVEHTGGFDGHVAATNRRAVVERKDRPKPRRVDLDLAAVGDEDPVEGRAVATRGAAELDVEPPEASTVMLPPLMVVPSSSVRTAPAPAMSTSIRPLLVTKTPSRVAPGPLAPYRCRACRCRNCRRSCCRR